MKAFLFFGIAALGELSGCYAFWAWLRLGKSIYWTLPGLVSLVIFALALTQIEISQAGRVYAAYGGIYLLSSLMWLWLVEGVKPDRADVLGVAISLVGTLVILFSSHRHLS